jgi:hypothetical protein
VNPKLEKQAEAVLGLVRRARQVFGGEVAPVEPPVFAARRDLEDDLDRGCC